MVMIDKLQEKFQNNFRHGNILLLNADCLEVMAMLPEKSIDLACVDPPYFDAPQKLGYYGADVSNTKVRRGNYKTIPEWEVPGQDYFSELERVSKNQIIWGINYYAKFVCSIASQNLTLKKRILSLSVLD